MPFQTASLTKFAALPELLAHEEKLLAGMAILIGVEETQGGEVLPHVAGHLVEERVFAVDDFVVRERQDEVFRKRVEQREGELVLVVFAVDGVVGEISERVVHPAHVPFETEAEAAEIGGA